MAVKRHQPLPSYLYSTKGERIMKFQFIDSEKIEKIKKHFKDHKTVYLASGASFVLGSLTMLALKGKRIQIVNTNTVTPIFNNHLESTANFGGYAHKVVKCLETNQIWESVNDAAEALGTTQSTLSKVLNGHTSDFAGKHYAIIALGSGS